MSLEIFVLRDSRGDLGRNAMFWAMGGGYTANLNNAERFSLERAIRQNKTRDTDLPLPLNAMIAIAQQTVDCQHLDKADLSKTDGMYVLQYQRKWDGNDIYFHDESSTSPLDGVKTTNLNHATQYTHREAMALAQDSQTLKAWPLDELKKIARPVVPVALIQTAVLSQLAGINPISYLESAHHG